MMGRNNVKGTQLVKDKFHFKFTASHALRASKNIVVRGDLINNQCYTERIIVPTPDKHCQQIHNEFKIHWLQIDAQLRLWHEQLCHCNDFVLENAHKHIIGVPKLRCKHGVLDNCLVCLASKLT